MNTVYFIVLSALVILYMIISIRKNRIGVTNSFMWIVFCIGLLFLSIWPKSLDWLADFVGISYPPTLFLSVAVVILFIIDFAYSKKIETLQKKVTDLAQEVSIVKAKQNEKK